MSGQWKGSTRRLRLPPNWESEIVPAVKRRSGGKCEVREDGRRCGRRANGGVDHIIRNGGDQLDNLQDTCWPHHRAKTTREGVEAKAAIKAKARRREERHPGDRT